MVFMFGERTRAVNRAGVDEVSRVPRPLRATPLRTAAAPVHRVYLAVTLYTLTVVLVIATWPVIVQPVVVSCAEMAPVLLTVTEVPSAIVQEPATSASAEDSK